MESITLAHPPLLTNTARCRIAGWAALTADAATIQEWRRKPIIVNGQALPVTFLKHAEEQTVVALRAVLDVIEQQGWRDRSFADWGVIAGAQFFGRGGAAQTIQRFRDEGPWGVSPHMIPHQSLHGISGTISQALKMYGPNFSISGGPNPGPDTLLIAPATANALPGLWVVITGYETEWIPTQDDSGPKPRCRAVALALAASGGGMNLVIGECRDRAPAFDLASYAHALSNGTGCWRIAGTHCVRLEQGAEA